MKFMLRKVYRILSLSFIISLAAVAYVSAATEVYNTSNNPLFITNSTWDQRLTNLQTTLQTQSANISTLVTRFGWNGTYTFSQGFELLYNDVHSLVSASTNPFYIAFDREFPNNGTSVKTRLDQIYSNGGNLWYKFRYVDFDSAFSNIQHIDSDIHVLNTTVSAISSNTSSLNSNVIRLFNLTNSQLPAIRTSVGNVEVDVDNIRSDVYAMMFDVDSIDAHTTGIYNTVTSYVPDIYSDLNILQEFFADPDTVAQKQVSKASSDSAIDSFTGQGQNSVSSSDFLDVSNYVADVKSGFSTGNVSPSYVLQVLSSGSSSYPWQWFSQDTYNSINPQPIRGGALNPDIYLTMYEDLEQSDFRKSSSDTPLLDAYNLEISQAVFE